MRYIFVLLAFIFILYSFIGITLYVSAQDANFTVFLPLVTKQQTILGTPVAAERTPTATATPSQ